MFMVRSYAAQLHAKGLTLQGIASRLHDSYRAHFFVQDGKIHQRTGPDESEVVFDPAALPVTMQPAGG